MVISKNIAFLFWIFFFCGTSLGWGQLSGGGEDNSDLHTNQESLEAWQDMRFGMFIHWGPVTLRGTEIGWSRGREVDIEDYDSLYKEFNPLLFDADEWVQVAKQAGMKYLIITAKHHDGFSLWDTEYSDYNIMNTPYGKDVLKALAEACEKQGIEFGIYYSIADWYHPDYPGKYPYVGNVRRSREFSEEERQSMSRYIRFMKNQLKEIIENYEPFVLWFDGEWEWPWTHEMGMDMYAFVREQDPDILVNNRVDKGRQGMAGTTVSDKYAGDYETPEQEIGSYNTQTPWESAITIGKQWAWKPNDELKSKQELVEMLIRTSGGDGNLLLNVGPILDGRIEQRQVHRLQELGEWLDRYGDSIYKTRGGPYMPTETFASSRKNDRIFLHLLRHPGSQFNLFLPEGVKVLDAQFMNSNERLEFQTPEGELKLSLPDELPDPEGTGTVIELQLNEDTGELGTIDRFRY